MARKRKMPFENKFLIKQELPTTYRVIGDGSDLKTAKNKVQAKNVTAKVTPPKLTQPTRNTTQNEGGRDTDYGGITPNQFARQSTTAELTSRLGSGTFSGRSGPLGLADPTSWVGGMLGQVAQKVAYEGRQRSVDRNELSSRRTTSVGDQAAQISQAMDQATKAPTNNVVTGAQRGGGISGGFGPGDIGSDRGRGTGGNPNRGMGGKSERETGFGPDF